MNNIAFGILHSFMKFRILHSFIRKFGITHTNREGDCTYNENSFHFKYVYRYTVNNIMSKARMRLKYNTLPHFLYYSLFSSRSPGKECLTNCRN